MIYIKKQEGLGMEMSVGSESLWGMEEAEKWSGFWNKITVASQ